MRRVVMGEPEPGASRFTHVEEVDALEVGTGLVWLLWGWDEPPTLPHRSVEPFVPRSFFPPAGGVRICAVRYGAEDRDAATEEGPGDAQMSRMLEAEACGLYDDPARPRMHSTDSIDIGVVVGGEITVEADDGTTVLLRPGDVYIQHGALHRWHAEPDNPGHVVFVLIGVTRAGQQDAAPPS